MLTDVADSVAYTFGRSGGLVSVRFVDKERVDTQSDRLAVGLTTDQTDCNAVILRVASANTNDFIELELVSSHVIRYL